MPATATVLDHVRDLLPSFRDRAAAGRRAVRPWSRSRSLDATGSSGMLQPRRVRRAEGDPASTSTRPCG